jgi:hypothetical protein
MLARQGVGDRGAREIAAAASTRKRSACARDHGGERHAVVPHGRARPDRLARDRADRVTAADGFAS